MRPSSFGHWTSASQSSKGFYSLRHTIGRNDDKCLDPTIAISVWLEQAILEEGKHSGHGDWQPRTCRDHTMHAG